MYPRSLKRHIDLVSKLGSLHPTEENKILVKGTPYFNCSFSYCIGVSMFGSSAQYYTYKSCVNYASPRLLLLTTTADFVS